MNWELIIGLTVFSLVLGWISDVAKGLIKIDNTARENLKKNIKTIFKEQYRS